MADRENKKKPSSLRHKWNELFGQLFLILLLVLYTLGGAIFFRLVERPTDMLRRRELIADVEWTMASLWQLSQSESTEAEWANEFISRMQMLRYRMCSKRIWEDVVARRPLSPWTSLLTVSHFCLGVYSTTCLGDIAPATSEGRLLFIFYSIIGIPLCLVVLAKLGAFFTKALKWLLFRLKYWYYGLRVNDRSWKPGTSFATRLARLNHVFSVLTIAHGSRPPPGNSKDVHPRVTPPSSLPDNWRDVEVPGLLVTLILAVYLFGSAVIFSFVESWHYLDAVYFVFTTLLTIGIGDFLVLEMHIGVYMMFIIIGLLLFSVFFNVTYEQINAIASYCLNALTFKSNWPRRNVRVPDEDERSRKSEAPIKSTMWDRMLVDSSPDKPAPRRK